MKFSAMMICVLLTGIFHSNLFAGQVYTWTDEKGNLHVTDTPPPSKSKIKDTLEYQEKSAADLQELQNKKERRSREREQETRVDRVEAAKKRAREADKAAQIAAEQADQITREVEVYVRRLGSTKEKRKQFRKRIQREIQRAESAQARAKQAALDARRAAEDARQIEEEFNNQQAQTQ